MNQIQAVDAALDAYVAIRRRRGTDPDGIKVATLATLMGCSRPKASTMLQVYRQEQARPGATRYKIQCRGYGREARWSILRKPSSDPVGVQEARREALNYVIGDMAARLASDIAHEVQPGLAAGRYDPAIRMAIPMAEESVRAIVRVVERALGLGVVNGSGSTSAGDPA